MSNEHITDERAAFVSWSQREYRHATIYTNRDFEIGLAAWEARAALRPAAQPAVMPSKYGSPELQVMIVAHAAQPVGEPVAYFVTWPGDPVGMRRFYGADEWGASQKTVEYFGGVARPLVFGDATPQPVAVPDRVPMTPGPKKNRVEIALETTLDRYNERHGITTPKADK